MAAKIWSIASGKGGVGKTFICSSLGITLSKLNYKVLLVDFDTSGANLHTHLGMPLVPDNIRLLMNGEKTISDIVIQTKIPKLYYIQGFWDLWATTDFFPAQARQLIKSLKNLDFDYIIIDLGSGALAHYLEAFDSSDERIMVANSEPTSIEKTYRFIETYMCYSLKQDFRNHSDNSVDNLQNTLRDFRQIEKADYISFRTFLGGSENYNSDFFESLLRNPIRVIINTSRSRLDQDLGYSVKSVCKKYYDINLDYLGFIDFDNAVTYSIRDKEPVLIEKPFTPLAGQFLNISRQLTSSNFQSNLLKEVV